VKIVFKDGVVRLGETDRIREGASRLALTSGMTPERRARRTVGINFPASRSTTGRGRKQTDMQARAGCEALSDFAQVSGHGFSIPETAVYARLQTSSLPAKN